MLAKLKSACYNVSIKRVGKYYKIQVGSFSIEKNAKKLVEDLKKKGFSVFIYEEVV